jgi:hypothetical protein
VSENTGRRARRNVCGPAADPYTEAMNETERALLAALNELDEKVRLMKTTNPKPNLLPIFERLDSLTAQLGRDADHSLLHYLHKKSYEKALLYLQGRDAENARGACHH